MLNPLKRGSFVIGKTRKRFYIGEVLDLYKKGNNSRYGSVTIPLQNVMGLSFLSLRVYLPVSIS
jgi:hypothetical protein